MIQKREFFQFVERQMQMKTPCDDLKELARFSVSFGKKLELDSKDLLTLEAAAYLHDIGKLLLPDSLLKNTSSHLNDFEWIQIEAHPKLGYQMLADHELFQDVLPVVLHHHERYNGCGYPDKLEGENIPYLARVFSLCDSWKSMLSNRPYRPALEAEQVIQTLEREADLGLYDQTLVETFLRYLTAELPQNLLKC